MLERDGDDAALDLGSHAASTANVLREQLDVPYILLGHSMGGLIAFEIARSLWKRGAPLPVSLIVSACRAPSRLPVRTGTHLAPDTELLQLLMRLGGTPRELLEEPELRATILETVRRDYALLDSYEYRSAPPLSCSVAVWRGDSDPETVDERIHDWARECADPPVVHTFAGGHFYPLESRHAVAETLTRLIGS